MHIINKYLAAFLLLSTLSITLDAQTNVSGTISTNTTWTIGGSPYIVLDTVMIATGVQLTIQPGVSVKFADGAFLYTNSTYTNATTINAVGTSTDSITFTSNSMNPIPGIYVGIQMNGGNDSSSIFKYCKFEYATTALFNNQGVMDLLPIENSTFINNMTGLKDNGRMMYINSCHFKYNTFGLFDVANSTITNCNISQNQTGFDSNNSCGGCGNNMNNCIIDYNQIGLSGTLNNSNILNCKLRYNQYGAIFNQSSQISLKGSQVDSNTVAGIIIQAGFITIDSCKISYNTIGIIDSGGVNPNFITRNRIENNVLGIKLGTANDDIHCNKICNNTSYDLKSMTTNSVNVANNYWCTTDSATIEGNVFDGHDSLNLGFVNFMPFDTVQCFNCSNILVGYTATLANFPLQNASATAYPTNGNPPYSYSWSTSPIQTTQTATGLGVGTYTVCVTDSMGCVACINVFIGDSNTLYVNTFQLENSFVLFPNPATNQLTISLQKNAPKAEIKLFNILGELEYATTTTENKTDIDVSTLVNGVHIIQIVTGDKISRGKFIKQ